MKHIIGAIESAVKFLDRGNFISPGSILHDRLKNELIWYSNNAYRDILQVMEGAYGEKLTKENAHIFHDAISGTPTYHEEMKAKLHFIVNLKLKRDEFSRNIY